MQRMDMTDAEFAELPVSVQQSVARGEVTIELLMKRAAASINSELCPRCGYHKVSARYPDLGLCISCARTEMTDAQMQVLSELEVERENARIRKSIQRVRDELDPDRPRRGGPPRKSAQG